MEKSRCEHVVFFCCCPTAFCGAGRIWERISYISSQPFRSTSPLRLQKYSQLAGMKTWWPQRTDFIRSWDRTPRTMVMYIYIYTLYIWLMNLFQIGMHIQIIVDDGNDGSKEDCAHLKTWRSIQQTIHASSLPKGCFKKAFESEVLGLGIRQPAMNQLASGRVDTTSYQKSLASRFLGSGQHYWHSFQPSAGLTNQDQSLQV